MILCAVFLCTATCGKKTDLSLPKEQLPFQVERLNAFWEDGGVVLNGAIIRFGKQVFGTDEIKGIRLYQARFTLENPPCDGCPIDYPEYRLIWWKPSEPDVFRYATSIEKRKGIYFFRVRFIGRNGQLGPFSNQAKLIAE
jgi:hypothetical protein